MFSLLVVLSAGKRFIASNKIAFNLVGVVLGSPLWQPLLRSGLQAFRVGLKQGLV